MRRVIAALVVVGLAIGVFLLWPRTEPDDPPNTIASPSTTTTSTSIAETTTSVAGTTSTTDDGSHVVETVEEAEAILAAHYYRWFRGIFERDEDLIRSTVILDSQVEAAVAQFDSMEFTGEPASNSFLFAETEILRSDSDCLAVWSVISATFRPGSAAGVVVLRHVDSGWKFLSSWTSANDLWEADCEVNLQQ